MFFTQKTKTSYCGQSLVFHHLNVTSRFLSAADHAVGTSYCSSFFYMYIFFLGFGLF